jgi:ABC-type multidrug transport system ATPase subunit
VTEEKRALDVMSLCVSRGGRRVLDGVSFAASSGEVLAVVGPNGAGKSTLLEAIVGLVPSSTTRLVARGAELRSFAHRAQTFAYMPDDARLPEEVSVRGLLAAVPNRSDLAADYARRLGVEALLERHGQELSRGEAKRVSLVLAMSLARPIIVLDEPFGAFDPLQLDGILDVVRDCARAGAAVIVTIHQMSTAERIADRVVLLAEGRSIAAGTLPELRRLASAPDAPFEEVFRRLLSQRDEHVPA